MLVAIYNSYLIRRMLKDSTGQTIILRISYVLVMLATLYLAMAKLFHKPSPAMLPQLVVVFYIMFAATALLTMYRSSHVLYTQRYFYTVLLLFFPILAAVLFMHKQRK
jgi:drug/metabolite transporter (DMT)-like permease